MRILHKNHHAIFSTCTQYGIWLRIFPKNTHYTKFGYKYWPRIHTEYLRVPKWNTVRNIH